jgi:hypothetical protein
MVGDHEQFTAFLALAANRLGVPARAVVGAVPGSDGVVTGSDVTSWVEIRVEDGSWRILPAELYLSTRTPKRSEPPKKDPGTFVAEAEEERARKSRPPTAEPERERLDEVVVEPPSAAPRWVGGFLLGVAVVGWVPGVKWLRRWRRRTTGSGRDRVSGAWQELLDLVEDLEHKVPAVPRPTQAALIGRGATAARLADGVFALDPPRDELVDEMWSLIDAERRSLVRDHGWRGHLRAWWNPASLAVLRTLRTSARRALSGPAPQA